MDVAEFRTEFPEFSDTSVYPSTMILSKSFVAELQVLECTWKRMRQYAVKLYVAHELTISSQNVKAAKVGGVPGTSGGIANTKTVGSVTVGYDSNTSTEKDAGWWNRSTYGQEFIRLARIFGAGAIQL